MFTTNILALKSGRSTTILLNWSQIITSIDCVLLSAQQRKEVTNQLHAQVQPIQLSDSSKWKENLGKQMHKCWKCGSNYSWTHSSKKSAHGGLTFDQKAQCCCLPKICTSLKWKHIPAANCGLWWDWDTLLHSWIKVVHHGIVTQRMPTTQNVRYAAVSWEGHAGVFWILMTWFT
jgi:hypothetical protein